MHVTALGGAYAASAEGIEGTYVNTAAPAVRDPYSVSWFEYDASIGVSVPGAYSATDFENRGPREASYSAAARFNEFLYVNVGGQLRFGPLGVAATADLQRISLSGRVEGDGRGLQLQVARWGALAAYSLDDGQIAVGVGLRGITMEIGNKLVGVDIGRPSTLVGVPSTAITTSSDAIFKVTGFAPQVGVLIKPNGRPWRFGATVRGTVTADVTQAGKTAVDANGVRSVAGLVLPEHVTLPWEVELGFALQLGPRPLNPRWLNPHDQEAPLRERIEAARARRARLPARTLAATPAAARAQVARELDAGEESARRIEDEALSAERERLLAIRKARYENWPRERILLLASVLLTGPSEEAVGMQSFLDQRYEPFGRTLSVSPRLGLEGEPVVSRIKLRAGSYLEPSRFDTGYFRQHFTFGADVKLLPFSGFGLFGDQIWRISFALDLAPRFTNYGISLGAWH